MKKRSDPFKKLSQGHPVKITGLTGKKMARDAIKKRPPIVPGPKIPASDQRIYDLQRRKSRAMLKAYHGDSKAKAEVKRIRHRLHKMGIK